MSALVHVFVTNQKVTAITADPADNAVLECALASDASFIISGDDHLLSLKSFQLIPIVTPREFLKRLRA